MTTIPTRLKPDEYEKKWQKKWEQSRIFSPDFAKASKPYYNLMMFPYPSAEGLHVGNMYAFTGVDIHGRFMRMQGYDVFEPIGLDGFGIHSENYALKVNKHPKEQAAVSQKNFYRQMQAIGNSFDWERTLETYDTDYYRWTQWLFVQMFKHGLAYRAKAQVNWCPSCKTVLADEQVIDGKCERCSSQVTKKELEQWFFKITAYAERLLQNTYKPTFNWSEKVKIGQRNWIGKKDGIEIDFKVKNQDVTIKVFTTTPVNFAATFLVLAPEHPIVLEISSKEQIGTVKKYIDTVKQIKKEDRIAQGREKTGVFTGAYAINHVTNESIPIWISDFVLMDVGTGAIQACPGHDMRDFEFAKKFRLPIKRVVVGLDGDKSPIERDDQVIESGMPGRMVNSDFLNGLEFKDAMEKTKDYFVEKSWGKRVVAYHLRDWLISRQRYWGAPIPMVFCEVCAKAQKSWFDTQKEAKNSENKMYGWYPVNENALPVELPDVEDWRPTGTGRGPLAGHPEFYNTRCPNCDAPAERETDVCDTFLDSSWYYLRYPFAHEKKNTANDILPWDKEILKNWTPIDSYIGGAEHTVLHLLYTRFVWQALRDWHCIDVKHPKNNEYDEDEPFKRFFAHGLIIKDGAKMSKSKGNVVIPDEYIQLYGADTLRTYLMFLGPFEHGGDFRDSGIAGIYRWLSRVWRLVETCKENSSDKAAELAMDLTITAVTRGVSELHYNSAIARLMEFTNWWSDNQAKVGKKQVREFLLLLSPFAPHMTEELWEAIGENYSVHVQQWPTPTKAVAVVESVNLTEQLEQSLGGTSLIIVQVNGKVRDQIVLPTNSVNDEVFVKQKALKSANVQKWLDNKQIKKTIFISAKLINFVV